MKSLVIVMCLCVTLASSEIFFEETFSDGVEWEKRWLQSTKSKEFGEFKLTAGKYHDPENKDEGIQTSQDAKFYASSSSFDSFSNKDKTLVVQFSVKHEQTIDCGGGYVKLFPSDVKAEDMDGDSAYNIMFGPDICGPGTKKVHVIFRYKGNNLLIKRDIRCKDDEATHIYTLIVKPDNTYEVLIDNVKAQDGTLEADWDFLAPKEIKDPDASKPSDWDDNEKIDDPEDSKPEEWDKPEHVVDPDATQPEDWDDEMDGEWEAPMIDNPEYKGEWSPKQIDNPNYSGVWVHPMIANPEYVADDELYSYEDFGRIGLDLWQVKSGTVFDNFLITDDPQEASTKCDALLSGTVKAEKKSRDEAEEKERKQREQEEKDSEDDNEDEDEEEEDEEEEIEPDLDEEEEDETYEKDEL